MFTYILIGFIYSLYCMIMYNYETSFKEVSIGSFLLTTFVISPFIIFIWPILIIFKSIVYDLENK